MPSGSGTGLHFSAPNFVLLDRLPKFRLQGDQLLDQPVEAIGVAGLGYLIGSHHSAADW
jgi:hypothetical protein